MISAIVIMIIFSNGYYTNGNVTTQEFNSMAQCEYVKSYMIKNPYIKDVWCVNK